LKMTFSKSAFFILSVWFWTSLWSTHFIRPNFEYDLTSSLSFSVFSIVFLACLESYSRQQQVLDRHRRLESGDCNRGEDRKVFETFFSVGKLRWSYQKAFSFPFLKEWEFFNEYV
jgi:hypothetical protein